MLTIKIVLVVLFIAMVLLPLEFPPPGVSQDEYAVYKQYVEARLKAIEDATSVRATSMESRLEGINEFRGQLKDQQNMLITRTEVDGQLDAIRENIKNLELSRAQLQGKADTTAVYFAGGIGLAGLILAGMNFMRTKDVGDLKNSIAKLKG